MNEERVIAHIDRLVKEEREFRRELLARHDRVTERLIRSLERTFVGIQEEAQAIAQESRAIADEMRASAAQTRSNTEETRAQTQAILRMIDRLGPSDAPA